MDEDIIIVAYDGSWFGRAYKNGTETLVFCPLLKTSYGAFMGLVHRIVDADQSVFKYVVHCLVSHEDSQAKWIILSPEDLRCAANMFKTPKFFVTLEWRRPPTSPPCNGVMNNHPLAPYGADLVYAVGMFFAEKMGARQLNEFAKIFEGEIARKRKRGLDGEAGRGRGRGRGKENADAIRDGYCPD